MLRIAQAAVIAFLMPVFAFVNVVFLGPSISAFDNAPDDGTLDSSIEAWTFTQSDGTIQYDVTIAASASNGSGVATNFVFGTGDTSMDDFEFSDGGVEEIQFSASISNISNVGGGTEAITLDGFGFYRLAVTVAGGSTDSGGISFDGGTTTFIWQDNNDGDATDQVPDGMGTDGMGTGGNLLFNAFPTGAPLGPFNSAFATHQNLDYTLEGAGSHRITNLAVAVEYNLVTAVPERLP